MAGGLTRFGVSVEGDLIEKFDQLIESKGYTNRSEAIRDLMRDYLVENQVRSGYSQAMGTITLVYNHSHGDLMNKLTDIQHDFHDSVISTLHVHLDAHNCMEVLIVKGNGEEIETIAGLLIGARGVKHGKLVITGTGE